MKKIFAASLMTILFVFPALGKSITVVSPAAGVSWPIGSHQMITWTYAGIPDSTMIRIVLFQNGTKIDNIVQNIAIGTAGQGSFEWPVGSTLSVAANDGSGYSIKVRTEDASANGISGNFILTPKPQIKPVVVQPNINTLNLTKNIQLQNIHSIAITSPKAGDTVDPYNPVYVKWTKLGAQDANVSVTLLRNGAAVATLVPSTPNSGQYNWDPVPLTPDPGPYTVKVRTLDGGCEAVSGEFTMKEQGGITLLSPQGGEVWESGTSHAVTWKRLGNVQSLDIVLTRDSSTYKTLAQGIDAKVGTKTAQFVRPDYDGSNQHCYVVFIKHSVGGTSNLSGCITLTGNPDLVASATFSPSIWNMGADITFAFKVENKGAVRSQPCQGSLSFNGAVQKTFSIPAIDPGTSTTVNVHWTFSGYGTIKITADTGNANIEPDKTNNSWQYSF